LFDVADAQISDAAWAFEWNFRGIHSQKIIPAFFREEEFQAAFAQVWPKVKLWVARWAVATRRRVSRQDPAGSLVLRPVDWRQQRAGHDFQKSRPGLMSVWASRWCRSPKGQVKLAVRVMRQALALPREFQLD
jgi:hypothetical protein